jgi:malonate-semialdehyde dehydrogenase (acetylating) / methylmalonate-semialdehyde dehydrogenase
MTLDPSVKTLRNFIGGKWVPALSDRVQVVPNPATGQVLAHALTHLFTV